MSPCKILSLNITGGIRHSALPRYHPEYHPFLVNTCYGEMVIYQHLDEVFNITTDKYMLQEFFGNTIYFGYNGTIIIDGTIHQYIGSTYAGTIPECP